MFRVGFLSDEFVPQLALIWYDASTCFWNTVKLNTVQSDGNVIIGLFLEQSTILPIYIYAVQWVFRTIPYQSVDSLVPLQLFLFELQLEHYGVELHVEVVGFLQLPLVVLADVQRVPEDHTQTEGIPSPLWTQSFPPEKVLHAR